MALEAVVFPHDLFSHSSKQLYPMGGEQWFYELGELEDEGDGLVASECEAGGVLPFCNGVAERIQGPRWEVFDGMRGTWDPSCSSMARSFLEHDMPPSSPEERAKEGIESPSFHPGLSAGECRRKRRRTRSRKNEEEVANQRMTHIAVERNRRKQMNEHLAALRSLMPAFYVQRGDQASIVGGAINFVKELEQLLQSLEAQKRTEQQQEQRPPDAATGGCCVPATAAADVDVTMVDRHANLKVRSRRRPQQLLRMVAGLQGLRLTTLHLSVTTVDQTVFYSFSLRVEDDCPLSSVEEVAAAVHQMLARIQAEAGF